MHSNNAPKVGAARKWALQGALLRINPRCGTCWGVLQAEGRKGGLGRDVEVNGTRVGELEVAGGINRTGCSYDQGIGMGGGSKPGCSSGGSSTGESGDVSGGIRIGGGNWAGCNSGGCNNGGSSTGGGSNFGEGSNRAGCNNGGGNGSRAGVVEEVEEVEEAGDSWETTLLATDIAAAMQAACNAHWRCYWHSEAAGEEEGGGQTCQRRRQRRQSSATVVKAAE